MSVKIKKNGEFSDSGEFKNNTNLYNSHGSDPLKLLTLFESLSQLESNDSIGLQIQFNKYVGKK